jgi:hypothetical protein
MKIGLNKKKKLNPMFVKIMQLENAVSNTK